MNVCENCIARGNAALCSKYRKSDTGMCPVAESYGFTAIVEEMSGEHESEVARLNEKLSECREAVKDLMLAVSDTMKNYAREILE